MEDKIWFFKKQQIRRFTSSIMDNVIIKSYERMRTSFPSVKETYIAVIGVINNKLKVQAICCNDTEKYKHCLLSINQMKVKNTHNNTLPEWQLQIAVMHLIYIFKKKLIPFILFYVMNHGKKRKGRMLQWMNGFKINNSKNRSWSTTYNNNNINHVQ